MATYKYTFSLNLEIDNENGEPFEDKISSIQANIESSKLDLENGIKGWIREITERNKLETNGKNT